MLHCSMAVALGSRAAGEPRQRASSALGTTPGVVSQTFSLPDQLAGPCARPFFHTGAYAADAPLARPGHMVVYVRGDDGARFKFRRYRGKRGFLTGPAKSEFLEVVE